MVNEGKSFFCNPDLDIEVYLYKGTYLDSFLENRPVSPRHLLIFPKRHNEFFKEMSSDEWMELNTAVKESINIVWSLNNILKSPNIKLSNEGYNIGLNDGHVAGKTVTHLHWHIIPRFTGDVVNPVGGIRNVIPELGDYKTTRG